MPDPRDEFRGIRSWERMERVISEVRAETKQVLEDIDRTLAECERSRRLRELQILE